MNHALTSDHSSELVYIPLDCLELRLDLLFLYYYRKTSAMIQDDRKKQENDDKNLEGWW